MRSQHRCRFQVEFLSEMSSNLRRTQSFKNLGSQDSWVIVDRTLLDKRATVSQLVQKYQSSIDLRDAGTTGGWLKSVQFRTNPVQTHDSPLSTSWRNSRYLSSLTRSQSVDALSRKELQGTDALRALFESKISLQQDYSSSPHLSATPSARSSHSNWRNSVRRENEEVRERSKGHTITPNRKVSVHERTSVPGSENKQTVLLNGGRSSVQCKESSTVSTKGVSRVYSPASVPSVKARSALYLSKIGASSRSSTQNSAFLSSVKELCYACQTPVYPMERTVADKRVFHTNCFCCQHCGTTLRINSYCSLYGEFYCKSHYHQLFKHKGKYDEGFGFRQHKGSCLPKTESPQTKTKISPASKQESVRLDSSVRMPACVSHLQNKDVNTKIGSRNKQHFNWPPENRRTKHSADQSMTGLRQYKSHSENAKTRHFHNKLVAQSGQYEVDGAVQLSPAMQEKSNLPSFARTSMATAEFLNDGPKPKAADSLLDEISDKCLRGDAENHLEDLPSARKLRITTEREQTVKFTSPVYSKEEEEDTVVLKTKADLKPDNSYNVISSDCTDIDADITVRGISGNVEKDGEVPGDQLSEAAQVVCDDSSNQLYSDEDKKQDISHCEEFQELELSEPSEMPTALPDITKNEEKEEKEGTIHKLQSMSENSEEQTTIKGHSKKNINKKVSFTKGKSPLSKLFSSRPKEEEMPEDKLILNENKKADSKPKNWLNKHFQLSSESKSKETQASAMRTPEVALNPTESGQEESKTEKVEINTGTSARADSFRSLSDLKNPTSTLEPIIAVPSSESNTLTQTSHQMDPEELNSNMVTSETTEISGTPFPQESIIDDSPDVSPSQTQNHDPSAFPENRPVLDAKETPLIESSDEVHGTQTTFSEVDLFGAAQDEHFQNAELAEYDGSTEMEQTGRSISKFSVSPTIKPEDISLDNVLLPASEHTQKDSFDTVRTELSQNPQVSVQSPLNEVFDLFSLESEPITQIDNFALFEKNVPEQLAQDEALVMFGSELEMPSNMFSKSAPEKDQTEVLNPFGSYDDLISTGAERNIPDPFLDHFQNNLFTNNDKGVSGDEPIKLSSGIFDNLVEIESVVVSQKENSLCPEEMLFSSSIPPEAQTQSTLNSSDDWMSDFMG